MNLSLDFIIAAVQGRLLSGNSAQIKGISTDSRKITPGSLFVALKGEFFDGHDYIGQAINAGAVAAIVADQDIKTLAPNDAAIIQVDDTLAALQDLAAGYRQLFSLPVIAVTGSIGKTTTKDILADCLSSRYHTLKTLGNFNNEIGLPLTLLNLQPDHQAAVLEMGMRASEEIRRLSSLLKPTYAIITNVEAVHLETMGTLENIARAKCEVLEFIQDDGFALINGDNELLRQIAAEFSCQKYCFGFKDGNDIQIKAIINDGRGIQVRLNLFNNEEEFYLPLPLNQLAYNLAAAIGMAHLLRIDNTNLRAALQKFQPGDNRMNIIPLAEGGVLIDDSYNANPISAMAALETCQQVSAGRRKVAILGDMLELGSYEKKGHWQVGQKAAEVGVDLLVTIGSLAQYYREGALAQGMQENCIYHFTDRQAALTWLQTHVNTADVVLIKASRGMQLDKLAQDLFI
jgi:UDP-N-acetylmuramoyl-tripeptide--D-alanyl-D-alanine ligase